MEPQAIKQLFHQEFSKMVAVISKQYGLSNIQIAEDVVSATFLQAAETWQADGMPENPAAWLYVVAKRKALYHFRRKKIFDHNVLPELKHNRRQDYTEPDFSLQNIKDSQLQMLFAICHPAIASEAQIGLALRTLCGFGIDEIAEALSHKETINKRLYRARKKLRGKKIRMEMPPEGEIPNRLNNVLHIIYLLFNEGYYSNTQNRTLQKDLCLEAMRLGLMLAEHEQTNLPKTNALIALMCFHASRFEARQYRDSNLSEIILYDAQDKALWDAALIRQGMYFLAQSADGDTISSYHLEARIACWHCIEEDTPEKWADILHLYDQLLKINYSSSVALNRIYALYKVKGAEPALAEAEALDLPANHFYFVLMGELTSHTDPLKAKTYLEKARSMAKIQSEKQLIQQKIDALSNK